MSGPSSIKNVKRLQNLIAERLSGRLSGLSMAALAGLALFCIVLPNGGRAQNANLTANPDSGAIPVFTDKYPQSEFCADPDQAAPCTVAPVDVPEFDASFIYRFLAYEAQRPFDRFSWQSFVAVTSSDPTGNGLARWETYPTRRDLFSEVAMPNPTCGNGLPDGALLLASHVQSSGDILVDQAGNFILYETRINPVAANYIRQNGLDHESGRLEFANAGQPVDFPMGHGPNTRVSNTGSFAKGVIKTASASDSADAVVADAAVDARKNSVMGAQLLKFAWRILPDGLSGDRYFTRAARIALDGDVTLDGKPTCLDVTVGLVGMHLVERVTSGNGDRWIWSSFEHVGTVPLAANARRPNSIITDTPFADGCLAPDPVGLQTPTDGFLFYGGRTGAGGQANQSIQADLRWDDHAPYARTASGGTVVPPDIVRCWRLFSGTAEANFVWQAKLEGTVWANYMLLGTQWIGNPGGAPFGVGEVPRFLTNSALESFIQHHSDATCLGCHVNAVTDAGQTANFTFLLDPAR
tara:strand:+ start:90666 stop:92237 length:1572 start_codon:yes stop_codon:yes gene_type:complete